MCSLNDVFIFIIFQSVTTITFEVLGNVQEEALDNYLQNLLWEKNFKNSNGEIIEIYRLKVRKEVNVDVGV